MCGIFKKVGSAKTSEFAFSRDNPLVLEIIKDKEFPFLIRFSIPCKSKMDEKLNAPENKGKIRKNSS